MNAKEIHINTTSQPIAVSADALWEIAGPRFAEIGRWTTGVDRAEARGTPQFEGAPCAERVCHVNVSGYGALTERLTHYDAPSRELAYEVSEGLPGFMLLARNHWTVRELGPSQSALQLQATMRLKPFVGMFLAPIMRWQIKRTLTQFLAELQLYAETGQVSEAKQKRLAVLGLAAA